MSEVDNISTTIFSAKFLRKYWTHVSHSWTINCWETHQQVRSGVISLKSNAWEIKSGYFFLPKKWEHFINPSPKPSKVLAFHHIAPKPKQKSSNSFHVVKNPPLVFFHVIEPRLVVDLKKPEKKVGILFLSIPANPLGGKPGQNIPKSWSQVGFKWNRFEGCKKMGIRYGCFCFQSSYVPSGFEDFGAL